MNIETLGKINFLACMQENEIFFPNNFCKLNINLRIFLPLKNKRLFWLHCFYSLSFLRIMIWSKQKKLNRAFYLKQPSSLNNTAKFPRHFSKFVCICSKFLLSKSSQNLLARLYGSGPGNFNFTSSSYLTKWEGLT